MLVLHVVVLAGIAIVLGQTGTASARSIDITASMCVEDVELPLRIALRAIAPTAARIVNAVRAEVAAIWPRQGVPVEWVDAGSALGGDSRVLQVILQDEPPRMRSASSPPLAVIEFTDGRPGQTIVASTGSASALLGGWLRAHGYPQLTPMDLRRPGLLERLTARLTGWAVAHEIGHYVLSTTDHDRVGLMRSRFDVSHVIAPRAHFVTLAPDSAQRLVVRTHPCLDGPLRGAAR